MALSALDDQKKLAGKLSRKFTNGAASRKRLWRAKKQAGNSIEQFLRPIPSPNLGVASLGQYLVQEECGILIACHTGGYLIRIGDG